MAVMTTWLASTSHVARDEARLSPTHASWAAPSRVRAGSVRSSQVGPVPSPHAWSLRYWRVSSTWNRASRPQSKDR